MNVNGFAVYSKYDYCSRCQKYIDKGTVCEEHPNQKMRTAAKYRSHRKGKDRELSFWCFRYSHGKCKGRTCLCKCHGKEIVVTR